MIIPVAERLSSRILTLILLAVLLCSTPDGYAGIAQGPDRQASALDWPAGLPVYDHIVIVIEENKSYTEIIGNQAAPYINNVLRKEGANFTRMYAEEHPSQGNYFWLFSGDNQGTAFSNRIPSEENNPAYPFTAANLGEQLIKKGLSFKGYAESLPEIGFKGDQAANGLYARKHVPWISFANVPNGTTAAHSSNLRFVDFPADITGFPGLPTVAIVVPNQANDMHNGPKSKGIPTGDRWLEENLDAYYQWAKSHNSLLIVTFDESSIKHSYAGLTDPGLDAGSCAAGNRDAGECDPLQNRIATIFAGAHIKPGDYPEGQGITHVNLLRTIEAMYGLSRAGAQQSNAAAAGVKDGHIITEVFDTVEK